MDTNFIKPIVKLTCLQEEQISTHVEYEVLCINTDLENTISQIRDRQELLNQQILNLSQDSERFINNADKIDYTIAVASGIIAGIIDSVFVGEFSLDRGTKWGDEKIKKFVSWVAKKKGYNGDGGISGAVRFLENEYKIAADTVTDNFGGGLYHHLRDFSHHPTPVGLLFSILTQFTGNVYGTTTTGAFMAVPLSGEGLSLIGNTWQSKLTLGVVHWFFHVVSDVAGSSGSLVYGKYGTGLPGPIVSLLKEISSLKIFNNASQTNKFSIFVSKLFNGTLLSERDSSGKLIPESLIKFDLRAEIGVLHELGRQAIPVLLNECVVRSAYFIKQLHNQIYQNDVTTVSELVHKVDWNKVLPYNNRTISRMLTISTGCFFVVDIADAAIRSAVKNGGNVYNPKLYTDFVLRINFVNVGRFAIAIGTDIKMGMQRAEISIEQIKRYNELLHLNSVEIYTNQKILFYEISRTEDVFQEIVHVMNSANDVLERDGNIKKKIESISCLVEQSTANNPELKGIFAKY